jgi:hypothetical protein
MEPSYIKPIASRISAGHAPLRVRELRKPGVMAHQLFLPQGCVVSRQYSSRLAASAMKPSKIPAIWIDILKVYMNRFGPFITER